MCVQIQHLSLNSGAINRLAQDVGTRSLYLSNVYVYSCGQGVWKDELITQNAFQREELLQFLKQKAPVASNPEIASDKIDSSI